MPREAMIFLAFFAILVDAQNASIDPSTNHTQQHGGGVQLAGFHIEEFEMYFAVQLSLLLIIIFKMYFPLIPYVPSYLPQSLVLILMGVIFGGIFSVASLRSLDQTLWKLTPNMFFHFLLPPIVLEAAYSLYNRTFLEYLGSILIYAVLGTVMNFLIIGPLMYGLDRAGAMGPLTINVSFNSYLLFASLIVAVDPVAVLAIFQDISVEPGLYFMVFGESLLNDAVTVVLYRIMSAFVGVPSDVVSGTDVVLGIISFFTISLGGLLVGVVFGVATSLCTRWSPPHFGAIFILLMAYFSYIMGDCLGWSGIIAIIGCGLVQADYAFHNISSSCLSTVSEIIKELSEVCESFIFFLIGVQLFSTEISWSTGFCLWGLVACLVARTVVVFGLTYLINLINLNKLRITLKQQIILIYGGLRGAVAFSLGILVDVEGLGQDGKEERRVIVTATLFIIFFTVGVMGLTMKPLVKYFDIKLAPKENLSLWDDLNDNIIDHTLAGLEGIIGSNGRNRVREFFIRLDDRFIRHWLQRNPETHDQRIIKTYEKIALKLHYATIRPAKSSTFLEGLPELVKRKHMDSTLQLSSLMVTSSDPQLQDLFVRESASYDSLAHLDHEPTVGFTDDEESGQKNLTHPEWKTRTSIIDNGRHIERFQSLFLKNIKSKEKVLRSSRRRYAGRKELGDEIDRETAANTARNVLIPNPATEMPPKDYPMESPSSSVTSSQTSKSAKGPIFHLGDDD